MAHCQSCVLCLWSQVLFIMCRLMRRYCNGPADRPCLKNAPECPASERSSCSATKRSSPVGRTCPVRCFKDQSRAPSEPPCRPVRLPRAVRPCSCVVNGGPCDQSPRGGSDSPPEATTACAANSPRSGRCLTLPSLGGCSGGNRYTVRD